MVALSHLDGKKTQIPEEVQYNVVEPGDMLKYTMTAMLDYIKGTGLLLREKGCIYGR